MWRYIRKVHDAMGLVKELVQEWRLKIEIRRRTVKGEVKEDITGHSLYTLLIIASPREELNSLKSQWISKTRSDNLSMSNNRYYYAVRAQK